MVFRRCYFFSFTDTQGEMVGIICFDAMVLNAYYAKCHANGYPYDKNFQGVRNLLKHEVGINI